MGNSTSQTFTSVQDISNEILQVSEQFCEIRIDNNFNDNTIIVIGGTGSVTFKQRAVIENATCNMTMSLNNSIENILESMSTQDATAKGGFSINWSDVDQEISIYQYIKNSVTQIMTSTCNISATNNMNNNYIYFEDHAGDIYFDQSAELTNATCTMNSAATNEVYNSAKSEGDQTSKIVQTNPLLAALGICVLLGFLVFMIILTKGSGGEEGESSSSSNSDFTSSLTSAALMASSSYYKK